MTGTSDDDKAKSTGTAALTDWLQRNRELLERRLDEAVREAVRRFRAPLEREIEALRRRAEAIQSRIEARRSRRRDR